MASGLCGVIALGPWDDTKTPELESWYRDGLVEAPREVTAVAGLLVAADSLYRGSAGLVASRRAPLLWSDTDEAFLRVTRESLTGELLAQLVDGRLVLASDDCLLVARIDERHALLYSSCAGASQLYFRREKDHLVFASSVARLKHSRNAALSRRGLAEIIRFGAGHGPRTLLEGIERIPFAHCLDIRAGKPPRLRPYRQFAREPTLRAEDEEEIRHAILVRLERSVAAAGSPLALMYSGGVDSTLLARVAGARGQLAGAWLLAFSCNDAEQANGTEIARRMGIALQVRPFQISFADVLGTIRGYAVPTLDFSILPTYQLGRHIVCETPGCTLLDGTGGDAWFGFASLAHARTWRRLAGAPGFARNFARTAYGLLVDRGEFPFSRALRVLSRTPAVRHAGLGHVCASPLYRKILAVGDDQWAGVEEDLLRLFGALTGGRHQDAVSEVVVMDATMIAVSHFAAKSGQWDLGLQAGTLYPFLMPNVVELARRLPAELLYRAGVAKPLLKDLMISLGVEREHAYRLKSGFQPPLQRLLADPRYRTQVTAAYEQPDEIDALLTPFGRSLHRRLIASAARLPIDALFPLWTILALKTWTQALREGALRVH